MTMSGSALEVTGLSAAPNQKPPSHAPAESFAAFLKSVPGSLAQNDSQPSGVAPNLQGQSTVVALAKNLTLRAPQAGQTPVHKPGSDDPASANPTAAIQLAPIAPPPIAQPIPIITNSSIPEAVTSPKVSADKQICEIAGEVASSADAAAPPAGAAITGTQTLINIATPIATSAQIDLTAQAAGSLTNASLAGLKPAQRVAGQNIPSSEATSAAADIDQDGVSADVPVIPAPGVSGQPTAALSSVPGPSGAKTSTIDPSAGSISSTDASLSSAAGATPMNLPSQPAATQPTVSTVPAAPTPASAAAMEGANRAVALRVSRAIASGKETLTIDLHPAELGHVAVRLAFHGNSVDVQMVVSRQETFQAFNQDRAALEQQFSQAGIDLGSGGLDLRYSQTPAPDPNPVGSAGSLQPDDGPGEAQSRSIFLSDNLVNIVA